MTESDNKALYSQLTQLDDKLYNLLQSHLFFQEAVLNLANNGDEPATWLAGATAVQQWLKQSSKQLLQQFEAARHASCRG